jgi:lipopolysaccharide biosynthesis glycosyltransferase
VEQPLTVAICYSANWAPWVEIEVFALQKTNPGARAYLISDTAGQLDLPDCVFVDVEELYRRRIPSPLNVDGRFTRFALYRLLVPEVVPEARVLYVDADALVVGDLSGLWRDGLRPGDLVAGVQDVGILPQQLRAIGLEVGCTYVNAGVTLLDLDAIRAQGLHETWIEMINETWYSCHDQDVINMTCQGRINVLGNEYNSSLSTGFAPVSQVRIAHYAGPAGDKPWVPGATPRLWESWAYWAGRYRREKSMRRVARGR